MTVNVYYLDIFCALNKIVYFFLGRTNVFYFNFFGIRKLFQLNLSSYLINTLMHRLFFFRFISLRFALGHWTPNTNKLINNLFGKKIVARKRVF